MKILKKNLPLLLMLSILSGFAPAVKAQFRKPARIISKRDSMLANLKTQRFPMIDFHVHLKGGLTIEEVISKSERTNVTCGIAPNCGLNFPITNDSLLLVFYESMKEYPVLLGMQAEGREWTKLFSKETISKFDYVFTDALTFTDDHGKRTRLWIKEEVNIADPQAFMDMYISRILSVINNEPIDIFVNPTFLPECIAIRYNELWTRDRMLKVIDAAVKNHIAIEINDRYRIPGATFIKLAKSKGVKFSFGTNNGDKSFADLSYCREMIRECGLEAGDMFMPKGLK
jgi:histidinol phosphatase-like PHP family hydrolase